MAIVHHCPYHFLVCRESAPIKPLIRRSTQKSNNRTVTVPPEGHGQSAGLDESEKARPHDRPQATIQDPSLEQHGGQSSGRLNRRPSRQSTAPSEILPPIPDPQPFNLGELQQTRPRGQVDGYTGGAGGSRTNLQGTLGDRNASRGDLSSSKDSRELPIRENDKGRLWRGVRQNDSETSRTLLVLTLAYLVPDPPGGLVLDIVDAIQEGRHTNHTSRNPLRASFRLTLRSGHSV